ncbi:MAG: IMP dehydrogenase [Acidobacteria bacterium]|jgi:IMP dehydrogenase|nr:IMP dehydrogenase [Acidobacteriota bacterium]
MRELEPFFVGRTFDDFLFRPQHSPVRRRRDVDLAMPLVGGIDLALPVLGANMDTVVGEEMAKTLALEGGLGFLHRNCSIADQAAHVRYVKTRHSYVIEEPIVLERTATVAEARAAMLRHNASSFLIEEEKGGGILAGIYSHRDVPLDRASDARAVSDFMTPRERLVTRPPSVSLEEAERAMFDHRVEKLPLVDERNHIRGLVTMRDLKLYKQKPHSTKDDRGRLRVGAAVGAAGDSLERAAALVEQEVDVLLLDVAHADSDVAGAAVSELRKQHEDLPLVVGNVATAEAARWLADLGVDAIKVGVGPGRGCRTRLETGAGVPQLQAVRETYLATDGRVPIIADGGVRDDKDIFLAIACGASTVMLGSLLSGTDEAPGLLVEDPATRQKMKLYRGMTSPEAVADGSEGDELAEALRTPAEGQSVRVPYVGSVVEILARIRGHLQSAVSYAGESALHATHTKIVSEPETYLIPLSEASRRESYVR